MVGGFMEKIQQLKKLLYYNLKNQDKNFGH